MCACNSDCRDSDRFRAAVTGGSPMRPWSVKTVGECGAPPVVPSNPNSRLGRKARSPIRQGRVVIDIITVTVGIDVSKDRLARLVKTLEKELSSLDSDIDDAVRGSPAWREKEDLLASVPGVGPIIARTMIAE